MKTRTHHIPALTRTFATLGRCQQHAPGVRHQGELLTQDGTCPRCDREAFQARVLTASEAKEARKLQALTNVHAGKRRRMTPAEPEQWSRARVR